jgi:hypothetical protein
MTKRIGTKMADTSQEKINLQLPQFNISELQEHSRNAMVVKIIKELIPEILEEIQDNPTKKSLEFTIQYTLEHHPGPNVRYITCNCFPDLLGDVLEQLYTHFPDADFRAQTIPPGFTGFLCFGHFIPAHILLKMSW